MIGAWILRNLLHNSFMSEVKQETKRIFFISKQSFKEIVEHYLTALSVNAPPMLPS